MVAVLVGSQIKTQYHNGIFEFQHKYICYLQSIKQYVSCNTDIPESVLLFLCWNVHMENIKHKCVIMSSTWNNYLLALLLLLLSFTMDSLVSLPCEQRRVNLYSCSCNGDWLQSKCKCAECHSLIWTKNILGCCWKIHRCSQDFLCSALSSWPKIWWPFFCFLVISLSYMVIYVIYCHPLPIYLFCLIYWVHLTKFSPISNKKCQKNVRHPGGGHLHLPWLRLWEDWSDGTD